MTIREATEEDWDNIWPIFHEVVAKGDTYAYHPDTKKQEAYFIWMKRVKNTYIYEENSQILGTYFITTNYTRHVCNCGYMVSSSARGRGLATSMCEHSQKIAIDLGYKAMQFNFVAASNEGAVRLWEKLGFETVGRLPNAFNHPNLGFVDALVMYKWFET